MTEGVFWNQHPKLSNIFFEMKCSVLLVELNSLLTLNVS